MKCQCGATNFAPITLGLHDEAHHVVHDGVACHTADRCTSNLHCPFAVQQGRAMPIPMILFCPNGHRHVDKPPFADKPHHTHACQECGIVWRPAIEPTVGVQFLPGFKDH